MKTVSTINFCGIVVVLFLFLISSTFGDTLEDRFEKTLPLRSGGYFSLSNRNGSVEISSWDREEVRIEALKKVKSSSRSLARDVMEELHIEVDVRGNDEVIVETDYPKAYEGSGGILDAIFGERKKPQISVQYWITVPEHVDLRIGTTNGAIEIEKITGDSHISSTNGRIEMYDVKGYIDVSTTNGKIELDGINGGLDAGTTNGAVDVYYSSQADIDEDISIRTTNGSIELGLPRDTNADVNARTTNGHIDTDFPITVKGRQSRKSLSGQINDGGPLIDLKTTNGSIHIRSSGVRI
jgi:DUF4097 and DUF4098 domain-containing protein YvlB